VPEVSISDDVLASSSFEELKEFADTIGVGYAGLDEEELKDRLRFEGSLD
jgi:hypothetical protein